MHGSDTAFVAALEQIVLKAPLPDRIVFQVRSLREHRDTSHRVRVFSEFAGIDLRRPQKVPLPAFPYPHVQGCLHLHSKLIRYIDDRKPLICPRQ